MKKTLVLLAAVLLVLPFAGCRGAAPEPKAAPADFRFSLTWGCYGYSSYDSATGRLVKTTDTTHPEDYVTYYEFSDEEKAEIYQRLIAMDIQSYPENYNPQNAMSTPDMTLIVTAFLDGEEVTVRAEHIGLSYESTDKKGQRFLNFCEDISNRLMATAEWKALPEYENFYD